VTSAAKHKKNWSEQRRRCRVRFSHALLPRAFFSRVVAARFSQESLSRAFLTRIVAAYQNYHQKNTLGYLS
jgi:hypothetical protein